MTRASRYWPPVHPDGTRGSSTCRCDRCTEWSAWIDTVAEARQEDAWEDAWDSDVWSAIDAVEVLTEGVES